VISYQVNSSPSGYQDHERGNERGFTSRSLSTNRFLDFKVSVEFLNFDWSAYQENSVCDFIYNFNKDSSLEMSGELANPKASIFYKTADESLKCRYRIIAKHNHYIRLTFESMDFNVRSCENVYFNGTNSAVSDSACGKMSRKVVVRELRRPVSSNVIENEMFYDSQEANDTPPPSGSSTTADSGQHFVNKMCICKTNRYFKQVYISKYDSLEIEYDVKLDVASTLLSEQADSEVARDQKLKLNKNFLIKYEILSRNCQRFQFTNLKSSYKGKLSYVASSNGGGIQDELVLYLNQSSLSQLKLTETERRTLDTNEEVEVYYDELETLKEQMRSNVNFYCRFFLRAPKNNFIHLEFSQLSLGRPLFNEVNRAFGSASSYPRGDSCDDSNIRLYSNFTRYSIGSMERFFNAKLTPFMRLCSTKNTEGTTARSTIRPLTAASGTTDSFANEPVERNTVMAEFYEESIINSSFACINTKNKICFLTSDIKHELNPAAAAASKSKDHDRSGAAGNRQSGGSKTTNGPVTDNLNFYNNLVVELLANNLNKFFFEIKYFYYKIDYFDSITRLRANEMASDAASTLSTGSDPSKLDWKKIFTTIEISNKDTQRDYAQGLAVPEDVAAVGLSSSSAASSEDKAFCDFKCYNNGGDADNSDGVQFRSVCLDESLVCDGEVHCIFSDLDERNCKLNIVYYIL
jgi:hypothetical protein